jgi:hypothetical protein
VQPIAQLLRAFLADAAGVPFRTGQEAHLPLPHFHVQADGNLGGGKVQVVFGNRNFEQRLFLYLVV